MEYVDWFHKRLTMLRTQKGVSARDMSLSLGQSESYINKIENKRTMPSLQGFFYICDYFGITPAEFFNMDNQAPAQADSIAKKLGRLTHAQAEHILLVINDLTDK